MKRIIAAATAAVLILGCSESGPAPQNIPADLVVHCGAVFDGLQDNVSGEAYILVRDQRISEILAPGAESFDGKDVLDLSDKTCLPGLIDMHVHLDALPEDADDYRVYLGRSPADTLRLAEKTGRIVVEAGFTTIRHTGSYTAWVDRELKYRIETQGIIGPRIRVGGPYLTIPHGGGDMNIPGVPDSDVPAYYRMAVARGPDEFRQRAEEIVAGGADFMKVIASGAVFGHGSSPGAPEMTYEEILAVVKVADAAGIKVTAHAHSAESIKDAILAGASSIEHASLGDDESVALAVEHDVAFSMDVYNGTYTAEVGEAHGYAEEFMEKNELTTEAQREVFRKALAAGVTLVFGTDLGVLPHAMGARQFEEMVKQGMTPVQAIHSATSVAAEHMGIAADVGAIEVGRYADLIAVDGNPLEDITVLQDVRIVIKGGDVVSQQSD